MHGKTIAVAVAASLGILVFSASPVRADEPAKATQANTESATQGQPSNLPPRVLQSRREAEEKAHAVQQGSTRVQGTGTDATGAATDGKPGTTSTPQERATKLNSSKSN